MTDKLNLEKSSKLLKVIMSYKHNSKIVISKQHDESSYHEVIDRISIIMGNIDDYLLGHKLCETDPMLKLELDEVMEILNRQYQRIATLRFNLFRRTDGN